MSILHTNVEYVIETSCQRQHKSIMAYRMQPPKTGKQGKISAYADVFSIKHIN